MYGTIIGQPSTHQQNNPTPQQTQPTPNTLQTPRATSFKIYYYYLLILFDKPKTTMPGVDHLPDISKMKISELKEELDLYCIDASGFAEKQDFTSALRVARETLPRPSTTYREVEPPPPPQSSSSSSSEKGGEIKDKQQKSSSSSSKSSQATASGVGGAAPAPQAAPPPASRSSDPSPPSSSSSSHNKDKERDAAKKALAHRSPVTARQTLREHPSAKVLGERNSSFLPGSPFSFALRGSLHEDDSAVVRVPDGVCLTISAASVDRKAMASYLSQQGSIGVSLRISSEENPQLSPLWTFDGGKSTSYTVSDLGIRVCGPRNIRLLAYMEMGLRSTASVDVFVFGSVCLDGDKF